MRFLIFFILLFSTAQSLAQTKEVDPADLELTVTLETASTSTYQQEMVLLTIHGVYRRHITLEKLEHPKLEGINWMQLGSDYWYDSFVDGVKVKNLRRRMALFPEKVGRLKIGEFVHHLTLLDENNNWFKHDIRSQPLELDVQPAPEVKDWWFPVRALQVSDRWSNAPDQLSEGAGVLRIVTITATGVGPDMLPPMPELKSPSAHIFPHPEKRLVDLSPQGPVSTAFWRWTIKPQNGTSAILEPFEFSYFDSMTREMRTVTISAQRVAFSKAAATTLIKPKDVRPPRVLQSGLLGLSFAAAFFVGFALLLGRGRVVSLERLKQKWQSFRQKRLLRQSLAKEDWAMARRASHWLDDSAQEDDRRTELLNLLERKIFAPNSEPFDHKSFYRNFASTL